MKAKILFFILSMFLTSKPFYGQGLNLNATVNSKITATATGSLTMDKIINARNIQADFKSATEIIEALRLKLSCDVNSYYDEAIVMFNNTDPTQGAAKLMSLYTEAPELWSVKNGLNYSISFLGGLDSAVVVPITVKAGLPGNYTLTASLLESFGPNTEISLEDRAMGTFVKLGATPAYAFHESAAATIADRFFLHFVDLTKVPVKDLTAIQDTEVARDFRIYSADGAIMISSLNQQSGKIAVFDLNGRKIATGLAEAGANTRIDMHGNTGVYIVSVLTGKGKTNTKILVK
ncbi:MAG: T9SS type A sorting domain-containing protein [Bacteroidales bacterium]|nr:T9SS type A sorting domain-containing protein [Bacteroidales bacterium]